MVPEEGLPHNLVLTVGARPKSPRGRIGDPYKARRGSKGRGEAE